MNIAGIENPSQSSWFLGLLVVHVPLGVVAVIAGVAAMLQTKGSVAHTNLGSIYFWSLAVVFMSSVGLAAMRWREDYHLFILGGVAFSTALVGRTARRSKWNTQFDWHIVGMGVSYIVMLTAFYVDNGKNLPVWRDLPQIAYWLLPSAVGLPLIVRAVGRQRRGTVKTRQVSDASELSRNSPNSRADCGQGTFLRRTTAKRDRGS